MLTKISFCCRYLLQLFTEADCLDWALVLALVLRDAMAVLRLVSMARSSLMNAASGTSGQTSTIEIVTRLRDGLLALSHWVIFQHSLSVEISRFIDVVTYRWKPSAKATGHS